MSLVKMKRVRYCQECDLFNVALGKKYHRYKCHNPESMRKNGNYRIINKDEVSRGTIPEWCKLEDYPE